MNGARADLGVIGALARLCPACELVVCPPATLIAAARDLLGPHAPVSLGGQDCAAAARGAHTGDISAPMLADAGATHVILGHSERRRDHGESDRMVREKARAARAAGLVTIICLGETEGERAAGRTLGVVADQLARSIPEGASAADTVVAYEPVWAIGSGRVPSAEQIAEVHAALRQGLETSFGADVASELRILYGGSVSADNAAAIFAVPGVDGALVGGASLRHDSFAPIIAALDAA